ncbi:hypothetical protein, partial [Desulfosarcina sp.]|uniref:hypothetical protein n=1 Tax=Desulfosarcina sp. TaxID=2027861 RepID=UPI003970E963
MHTSKKDSEFRDNGGNHEKPRDISFILRGFAFSHVNLTHRNWTAVGHPDLPYYPIVDPRGLVTP